MKTVHLVISGRVQGVFFRATAQQVAEKMQIMGWIKNTPDGEVEVLAEGSEEQVNQFIGWCKTGPPKARVISVDITEKEFQNLSRFRVLR